MRACDDAMRWPDDIKVAVNLSPVQFKQAELFDVIRSALKNSGLPPARLEIEITESVLLERASKTTPSSSGSRASAYRWRSTISAPAIRRSAPDRVPVRQDQDRQVIHSDLTRNYKSTAIVCTIVTLARGLDMSVTAEGVETANSSSG